tara:strand:+ start:3219 stop:3584 length:366 start_codon:yes stop_codon:yes gene_type:complete
MNKENNILYYIPTISYKILFILVLLTTLFNIIYVYSTKFKKKIVVDEKHTYGSNNAKGSQSISDSNNNVYILKNSIYVLHWKSVEVFNKLDSGNTYEIEGHGIRLPILGWFPNITSAKIIN